MKPKKLNARQRKFVAAYAGNAAAAARAAGYEGTPHALEVTGARLLRHAEVAKAIASREKTEVSKAIWQRQDLQEFWTSIASDQGKPLDQRLTAARDLAKSHALFVQKHQVGLEQSFADLVEASMQPKAGPAAAPVAPAPPPTPKDDDQQGGGA